MRTGGGALAQAKQAISELLAVIHCRAMGVSVVCRRCGVCDRFLDAVTLAPLPNRLLRGAVSFSQNQGRFRARLDRRPDTRRHDVSCFCILVS